MNLRKMASIVLVSVSLLTLSGCVCLDNGDNSFGIKWGDACKDS